MGLVRKYYGLHQVITGQYTQGNEYLMADGSEYEGAYHIVPDGTLWTESRPRPDSIQLFPKIVGVSDMVRRYNKLKEVRTNEYRSPVGVQPIPDAEDYEIGRIMRYFVQKRNNPVGTILEIDSEQFQRINTENRPGINGVLYNYVNIFWTISQLPSADAIRVNRRTVVHASKKFPYLATYLTDMLEFYR